MYTYCNNKSYQQDIVGRNIFFFHGYVFPSGRQGLVGDDELDLEELGNVKDDRERKDGDDVGRDPPPGAGGLAAVVILHRPPHGPVSLHRQAQGHVDRAAEDKVVELVEEVPEGELVRLVEGRVLPDPLQDAADYVEVVRDGQDGQKPVEDGAHLFGEEDGDGHAIYEKPRGPDSRL